MSGRLAIFFATYFPDHLSQLIVVDTAMGKGNPGEQHISVGNVPKVFETVEQAMAHLAKKKNPPRFSLDRKRPELAMRKVEGGYVLTRDPITKIRSRKLPAHPCPSIRMSIRGRRCARSPARSLSFEGKDPIGTSPSTMPGLRATSPIRVETIDSRHDIAFEAPDELIKTVKRVMMDQPASKLAPAAV